MSAGSIEKTGVPVKQTVDTLQQLRFQKGKPEWWVCLINMLNMPETPSYLHSNITVFQSLSIQ